MKTNALETIQRVKMTAQSVHVILHVMVSIRGTRLMQNTIAQEVFKE